MSIGKLQEELKRKEPFSSPEQETIVSLLRTGDQLQNLLSRFLREHDLTISQFNLLRILQSEGRPMTCGAITEQLIHVVPALTGLVDRLEQQGLVQRERCTEDRRVVYVSITKAGLKLTEQTLKHLQGVEKQILKLLTPKDLGDLIRLLDKTRESIAASLEK